MNFMVFTRWPIAQHPSWENGYWKGYQWCLIINHPLENFFSPKVGHAAMSTSATFEADLAGQKKWENTADEEKEGRNKRK